MSEDRGGSETSHPINEAGEPEGTKAPEQTGDKSKEGKKRKRARFRRHVSLPRPSLPSVPRPKLPKPKTPKGAGDLRFRLGTRLRAMGYWLREKAQAAWRWIKQAAAALAYWWSKRSRATRMRIFAAAGVFVLYLIIKFLPVPGVPCQISAAKECAPSDDTIAYVPRDALLYAHMTVNSDSHQWELAGDLGDKLPNFTALLQSDTSSLATPAGRAVDLATSVPGRRTISPWSAFPGRRRRRPRPTWSASGTAPRPISSSPRSRPEASPSRPRSAAPR